MRPLDHVARKVLDDIHTQTPAKDYTEAMSAWRLYKTVDTYEFPDNEDILFTIYENRKQAEILEALILSECPEDVIETSLHVPVCVTKWYKELFYDISVFRTDLDRLVYLTEYEDEWARDLKTKAVNLGYEFVLFNFANLVPKTDVQKRLIERMFMATAYKAMAMNYNGIKSEVNKQAVKHAELMIKAYELLVKTNAEEVGSNYDLVGLLTVSSEKPVRKNKPVAEEFA